MGGDAAPDGSPEHVTARPAASEALPLVEVSRVRRKINQANQTLVIINVCSTSAEVLIRVYKKCMG